jgi:hypothetical protein
MPLNDFKYRARERARETGTKVKKMLDAYVRSRQAGDEPSTPREILWNRLIAVSIAVIIIMVAALFFIIRHY